LLYQVAALVVLNASILRYLLELTLALELLVPFGMVGLMVMKPARSLSGLGGVAVGFEMNGRNARPAALFIICMRVR